MSETRKMAVRLALREEGNFWNAYMALSDTMKGAKLIGSIALGAVQKNPLVKETFFNLMTTVMSDAILATTGTAPDHWDTEPAKDERSGNA